MKGMGRVYKRSSSKFYWIEFWHNNEQYRESSKSEKKSDAERLLRKRLSEIEQGKFANTKVAGRLTLEDMIASLERDYQMKGHRSTAYIHYRAKHLTSFFGNAYALDITTAKIRQYIDFRLDEGAANATINRELAALGRMFALALESELLTTKPYIPELPEDNVRTGFFEHDHYEAIRQHLRSEYQDVLDFDYHTGWRKGEIWKLQWKDVDMKAGVIRLPHALSKNKDSSVLVLSGVLMALLQKRWELRVLGCPYVFHVGGKRIGDWRKSWWTACRKAGLDGTYFHDLRRTVVRNLVRAHVPEKVAMSITGHKSRSVFDRYNIVSEEDLRSASETLAEYVAQQSGRATVIPLRKKI
jgi:integrase